MQRGDAEKFAELQASGAIDEIFEKAAEKIRVSWTVETGTQMRDWLWHKHKALLELRRELRIAAEDVTDG